MSIQLKPGKWKTRDGRVAVVEFRTECKGSLYPWTGYVENEGVTWTDSGVQVIGCCEKFDLISPWTEPQLRPWRPEEVPVGALIRVRNPIASTRHLIVSVDDEGIDAGRHFHGSHEWAAEHCLHSLDGGKTWLPCGVMEDGE